MTALGCTGELSPLPAGGGDAPAPDASPSIEMVFRPRVQADLAAAGCISGSACHGGTAAPMPLVASPATDEEWMANYEQVAARAGTSAASLLIDKATGAGGHTAALEPTDPVVDGWREWIAGGAPYDLATADPSADAGPSADAAGDGDALTWRDDIEPLLRARGCLDCHGNSGAYSLESYAAALGFGSDDVPNVLPGDASSVLATYCEQGHHDINYADALRVLSWIVDWDAREG